METKVAWWLIIVTPRSAVLLALEGSDLNDNGKGHTVCVHILSPLFVLWEMGRVFFFLIAQCALNLFICMAAGTICALWRPTTVGLT